MQRQLCVKHWRIIVTEFEKNKHEHELALLYERGKRQTKPAVGMRRDILMAAKKEELKKYSLSKNFKNWLSVSKGLSAITALSMLVAFVWLGQSELMYQKSREGLANVQYTRIQSHQLESESQLASEALRLKYDSAYKDYLNQQGALAAHHQSKAKLLMSEQGWQLATCDNELVEVSENVLAMLNELSRIDLNVVAGDSVNILFAFDGRILQILKSSEPLIC
ncbi:MAG: hypothetical protein ACI97K_000338 [Glaciecola sp.]|jgi:hypothetical protein